MSQNKTTQGHNSKKLSARPTRFDFSRDEKAIIVDFAGFVRGPKGGFHALARNLLAASVPVSLFAFESRGNADKNVPTHKDFISFIRDIPTINLILNGKHPGLENIPAARLLRLRAYLGALNGYDPAKGNNQSESTLDQHRLVVEKAESSLRQGLDTWGKKRNRPENGDAPKGRKGQKADAPKSKVVTQPERTIENVKDKNAVITKAVDEKDGKPATIYRVYKDGAKEAALETPFLKAAKEWLENN